MMSFAPLQATDRAWRPRATWVWLGLCLVCCGCAADGVSQSTSYRPMRSVMSVVSAASAQDSLLQARELDRLGQESAVDFYYQASVQALRAMPAPASTDGAGDETYQMALAGLINAGQRYGRLDPRRNLVVDGGARVVPIRYVGFAWQPRDFSRLESNGGQQNEHISRHFATPGVGVPLVGERMAACSNETFMRPWQPFAVTAVLRPVQDTTVGTRAIAPCDHVLEFYNPLLFDSVSIGGMEQPLARDLTAPLATTVNETPRQYFRGFTAPTDTTVQPQLFMLEPYQRGKIPVVFIHGLYSDSITWVNMINELRAKRDLYEQYQFWAFRYPTGGDVIESAAILRERLQLARTTFDPQCTDPALDQMVLVGHSLGGIVAKLQITRSGDLLWREVAQQPFSVLRAQPDIRARLARGFFYEPAPTVSRVIFIATPHRGSNMARRAVGRVSSALVSFGSQEEEAYRQLMEDNPQVFKPIVERRRPTTIDLLDPESPFLAGLENMPINCRTRMHSIVGTGGSNPLAEPGDGVVAVSSAEHRGDSQILVDATHEMAHRVEPSICEVARILRVHAAAVATGGVATTETATKNAPRQAR